eukprot:355003-Pyramimonas_sp.AAC.1
MDPLDLTRELYWSVRLCNVVGDITAQVSGNRQHVESVLARAAYLLRLQLEKLLLVISQAKGLVVRSHSAARVTIVARLKKWNCTGASWGRNLGCDQTMQKGANGSKVLQNRPPTRYVFG